MGTNWTRVLCATALLAGCSAPAIKEEPAPERSGRVDSGLILPRDSERMQLGSNQIFVAGEQTNPEVMPVYPADGLPLRLPDQTVCVKFVVGPDGSVSEIAPLFGVPDCPANEGGLRAEFLDATRDAVSRWDFFSFRRCTFPPGTPPKQQCNGPGATMEQVAVTLSYRFVFSAKDGGSVRKSTATPGS